MHRRISIASFAVALLAIIVLAVPGIGRAAGSTPAAGPAVVVQKLGQVGSSVAPGRNLILQERTFPAGSDSGAHPAPGPVVLYVESGTVTFKVIQGAALVTRAGGATEAIAAGGSAQLNTGDVVTYDQGVVHDVSNPGTATAVTIESRLNPVPTATPAPAAATP